MEHRQALGERCGILALHTQPCPHTCGAQSLLILLDSEHDGWERGGLGGCFGMVTLWFDAGEGWTFLHQQTAVLFPAQSPGSLRVLHLLLWKKRRTRRA